MCQRFVLNGYAGQRYRAGDHLRWDYADMTNVAAHE